MSFYDGVKKSVRNENTAERDEDERTAEEEGEDMPFDQLKKAAEESAEQEKSTEPDTDKTPIEVLTDDGLQREEQPMAQQRAQTPQSSQAPNTEQASQQQPGTGRDMVEDADGVAQDEVVAVLQRIEQQNQEIVNVLRGIKRSLDN